MTHDFLVEEGKGDLGISSDHSNVGQQDPEVAILDELNNFLGVHVIIQIRRQMRMNPVF